MPAVNTYDAEQCVAPIEKNGSDDSSPNDEPAVIVNDASANYEERDSDNDCSTVCTDDEDLSDLSDESAVMTDANVRDDTSLMTLTEESEPEDETDPPWLIQHRTDVHVDPKKSLATHKLLGHGIAKRPKDLRCSKCSVAKLREPKHTLVQRGARPFEIVSSDLCEINGVGGPYRYFIVLWTAFREPDTPPA